MRTRNRFIGPRSKLGKIAAVAFSLFQIFASLSFGLPPDQNSITPEAFVQQQKMNEADSLRFSAWIKERFGADTPLTCSFTTTPHSGRYSTPGDEEIRMRNQGEFLFNYQEIQKVDESQTRAEVPTIDPEGWQETRDMLLAYWKSYAERGWKFRKGCFETDNFIKWGISATIFNEFIEKEASIYSLDLDKISFERNCKDERGHPMGWYFTWNEVNRKVNSSFTYLSAQATCKPAAQSAFDETTIGPKKNLSPAQMDIVWVIDNSQSMKPYQDALSANLSGWIKDLVDQDIDFRIAVTTTDGRLNSALTGEKALNSETLADNPKQFFHQFKKAIQVGVDGNSGERHFDFALRFLDRHASVFLRNQSHLTILFLSDLDSSDSSGTSSKVFAKSLLKYRDADHLQLFGILSSKNRDNFEKLNEDKLVSIELLDLDATSGGSESISESMAARMDEISGSISKASSVEVKIALTHAPIRPEFEVYVDEVKTEPSTPVRYDTTTNTVSFSVRLSKDSHIQVRYLAEATR